MIYSSLKKSETDWNLVISVDSAFVEADYIQYLISEIDDSNAVVPIHLNGKEPLIALYHKRSIVEIKKMLKAGNLKMHNLLNALEVKFVDSNFWVGKDLQLFKNLNCPEDL